jgi:hypothetical protein
MQASEHESRSRELADTSRRYLVALNTGGVAISFGVAGSLAGRGVSPGWVVCPVVIFVVGLAVSAASLFLAKHKALKRLDAEDKQNVPPDYQKWYWANFTYEILTLVIFLFGVMVGLWELSNVHLPING